jgi:hypothetical protein
MNYNMGVYFGRGRCRKIFKTPIAFWYLDYFGNPFRVQPNVCEMRAADSCILA